MRREQVTTCFGLQKYIKKGNQPSLPALHTPLRQCCGLPTAKYHDATEVESTGFGRLSPPVSKRFATFAPRLYDARAIQKSQQHNTI